MAVSGLFVEGSGVPPEADRVSRLRSVELRRGKQVSGVRVPGFRCQVSGRRNTEAETLSYIAIPVSGKR